MRQFLSSIALLGLSASLSGCGLGTVSSLSGGGAPITGSALSGSVHGGQQPVSGASIRLYAAGNRGYGAASTSMLTTPVTTNASGGFSITGDYTCPSATTQVYLVALGGNPGLAGNVNNAQLAEMAALGNCGNLSSSNFINVNELTTVASVYALSPFMTGYASVGTSSGNTVGLVNAFVAVNKLVNIATGSAGGPALPTGATIPISELNTIANILAACVNSSGGTSGSTLCGQIFAASPGFNGAQPTDTVGLALAIARNPASNVGALFGFSSASAPFQPTLPSAPNDWSVAINYTGGGLNNPRGLVISGAGNLFVANAASGSNTISGFSNSGAALTGSPYAGAGISVPYAIAVDTSDNLWIANHGNSTVTKLSTGGTPQVLSSYTGAQYTGGGLNLPTSIALDGLGNLWLTNAGNNSVSEFSASGAAISGTGGITGSGIAAPVAIAVNPK